MSRLIYLSVRWTAIKLVYTVCAKRQTHSANLLVGSISMRRKYRCQARLIDKNQNIIAE